MSSRHIRGNLVYKNVLEKTGSGNIAAADLANISLILVNKDSGAATGITLPAPGYVGQAWKIVDAKGDANTNNITITPASGNINGAATFVISENYGSVEIVWDGTNYTVSADANTGTVAVSTLTADAIAGGDSSLGITGQAAAQGGEVVVTGGTSSTAGNAGGAASLIGGTPGATGAGGAVVITSGAGGATSGLSGAVTIASGTTTAGSGSATAAVIVQSGAGATSSTTTAGGASGAVTVRSQAGGAKTGTGAAPGGAAGAVAITGGAGGATASAGADAGGAGASVTLTGGAGGNATAGTGNGGAGGTIILSASAGGTSAGGTAGVDGAIFLRSSAGRIFPQQIAPVSKGDANASFTAAEGINGIIVHTVSTGRTLTTPTGAQLSAAMGAALAVGDSFALHVITVGTGADDISTLTAGDGNVTFVGKVTVGPDIAESGPPHGSWIFRNTGANTWVGYRVG